MNRDQPYDPFEIGGYVDAQPVYQLNSILTFADQNGRQIRITTADLLHAFLALDKQGLVPDPGSDWHQDCKDISDQHPAPHHPDHGTFSHLQPVPDLLCECCGSECHAVYTRGNETFLIERWSIVTAINLLVKQEQLPILPDEYYASLEIEYERICETGRYIRSSGSCGSEYV